MTNLALYVPAGAFGTVRNPFGKDTANLGLFRALARHGGFDELGILSHGTVDLPAAEAALFEGRPHTTRLWTESVLRTSVAMRAGAVLRGLPDIANLAWQRQAVGDRSHNLIGLVHTLAPPAVRQQIAGGVTAPLQPWDALVCTSPAVEAAARAMLERTADYFASRFGGDARPMPHLPLIPLGVEAEALAAQADRPEARARMRAALGVPEGETLVLWLGRLSHEEKAFPQPMFRAVQEARGLAGTKLHLAMAGWFPDPAGGGKLYAEAARAYAPDVPVHFLDGNDPARVADLWAAADVFLSLVDNVQETFGLTPLEAMAAGLPVVASDWDGYRYTVRDGVEGFLVPTLGGPPGAGQLLADRHALGLDTYHAYVGTVAAHTAVDVGRAAAALAALARDPALRRRMGEAGRARVQSTFAWPVVARQVRGLVDDLAALRAEAPRFGVRWSVTDPVRGEPFADFAGFATTTLSPGTRLSLRAGATSIRAELARANSVALDRYGALWRAEAGDPMVLLDRLVAGRPQRLDALLASVPAERHGASTLALAWMCKLGILQWEAEAPAPTSRDPFPGGWASHRDAHCIWVVTRRNMHYHAFDDAAFALGEAFTELGGSAPVIYGPDAPVGRTPIVFGAHLLPAGTVLPQGAVVFNLEQVYGGSPWFKPAYLDLLRRHPVLDYSHGNIAALAGLGVTHARHLPLGYVDGLTRIAPTEVQDIDVLFYGSLNKRRVAVLQRLHAEGLAVKHLFGVYGTERDAVIARSKVVLNLHMYEATVFEVARVGYLMANSACVVTEGRPDDPDLAPFRDGLAVCPYDGLVERCIPLARDGTARRALAERGAEVVRRFRQANLLQACMEGSVPPA